jgi:hypothetical protein
MNHNQAQANLRARKRKNKELLKKMRKMKSILPVYCTTWKRVMKRFKLKVSCKTSLNAHEITKK